MSQFPDQVTVTIPSAPRNRVKGKFVKNEKPVKVSVPKSQQGLIDQVRQTFLKQNRLAVFIGTLLGGFVPMATYITKGNVSENPWLWILVAGGLIYSASTMVVFMKKATGNIWKSIGWVVLTEGVLIFSPIGWLRIMALTILVLANSIATSCKLVDDSRESKVGNN